MSTTLPRPAEFLWLELTGKCQLACGHCYAESSPVGTHGAMTYDDWLRVLDEAVAVGVTTVQFIGGEPTLHPHFEALLVKALTSGLDVEVFTNLVHVRDHVWDLFTRPGVRLATSYYSDSAEEHEMITGRRGSHVRTRANIAEAVRRGIPIRAGVIDLGDGQRYAEAVRELTSLGVTEIGVDRLRQVGRGVRAAEPSTDQLCGRCGDGVLAVLPDGSVTPCVFSRWMTVGNVTEAGLPLIVVGERLREVMRKLDTAFAARARQAPPCPPACAPPDPYTPRCNPRRPVPCGPECTPGQQCNPRCGPACSPACTPQCGPRSGPCRPRGGCQPNYR